MSDDIPWHPGMVASATYYPELTLAQIEQHLREQGRSPEEIDATLAFVIECRKELDKHVAWSPFQWPS